MKNIYKIGFLYTLTSLLLTYAILGSSNIHQLLMIGCCMEMLLKVSSYGNIFLTMFGDFQLD